MRRKHLTLLIALSLLLTQARPAFAQTQAADGESAAPATGQGNSMKQSPAADKRIGKLKRVVNKVGVGRRIMVFLRNGDDLHGTVSRIGPEDFDVAEVDLQRLITVRYEFVEKVREGYGGVNLITGKRASPRRGTGVAIAAGVLFMAVGLPLILLGSMKD
jgi:hypothetical protein